MSSLTRVLRRFGACALPVILVTLLAPASAAPQECASVDIAAGCPFRCLGDFTLMAAGGPQPTPLGNEICSAVDRLAKAGEQLGDQATAYVQPAQDDLDALVQVTFAGAINPQAIQTFNNAVTITDGIEAQIAQLEADPECGSEAFMNELQQFFVDRANAVVAAGQIAGSLTQAITALGPALIEVNNLLNKIQQIRGLLASPTPATEKAALDALEATLLALKAELEALAALEIPQAVDAGAEMVETVGPFVVNCALCGYYVWNAANALISGGSAAVPSAKTCPSTFMAYGGSCWSALGGTIKAAAGSGFFLYLGHEKCKKVSEGLGKVDDHLNTINRFLVTSAALHNGLMAAGTAVKEQVEPARDSLAKALGSDMQAHLDDINQSLNAAIAALNSSSGIVNSQVFPQVQTWAGDALWQLARNVNKLYTCYNKVHGVAEAVAGDVVEGVADLVVASAHLLDGSQLAMNIMTQGAAGTQAAASYASGEFSRLRAERNRIHRTIWGVDWPQLPSFTQAVEHVVANPFPPAFQIVMDIVALELATASIVPNAIAEGKKAFLTFDADQEAGKQQFDLGLAHAQSGLTKVNNPGTLDIAAMPQPNLGQWAGVALDMPASEVANLVPAAPYQPVEPANDPDQPDLPAYDRHAAIAEALLRIESLRYAVRDGRGGAVDPGTTCSRCTTEWHVRDIWQVLDEVGVQEEVTMFVFHGGEVYADLGTHAPPRDGAWVAKGEVQAYTTAEGWRRAAGGGCDFRLAVRSGGGRSLAEANVCLASQD